MEGPYFRGGRVSGGGFGASDGGVGVYVSIHYLAVFRSRYPLIQGSQLGATGTALGFCGFRVSAFGVLGLAFEV